MIRSYCPEIMDLNLESSYHIASLFYTYIVIGERIVGKQYMSNLVIAGLPQCPPNSQKRVVNCFPLLYIYIQCDDVCNYVRAQYDPEKNENFFCPYFLC